VEAAAASAEAILVLAAGGLAGLAVALLLEVTAKLERDKTPGAFFLVLLGGAIGVKSLHSVSTA
jgi:hypothetical protein